LQALSIPACIAISITLAAAAGIGCAARPRPGTAPSPFDSSRIASCNPLPFVLRSDGGTIIVALTDSVAPAHAPVPRNESERLVFRNLYETLVTFDCEGRPATGLAESWSPSEGGRVWTFTIREKARFWDGTPVHPIHVKLSWMTNQLGDAEGQVGASGPCLPWTWLDAGADSLVTVLDERRFLVSLAVPIGESPVLFAHPSLAVVERRPEEAWPVGTGACRLPAGAGAPAPDLVCLQAGDGGGGEPDRVQGWTQLIFRVRPGWDLRDLHAEGVDALLARDRAALAYFATAPGYDLIALAWDRVYLLLTPAAAAGDSVPSLVNAGQRAELARDVVASDAHLAGPGWFAGAPGDSADPAGEPCGSEAFLGAGVVSRPSSAGGVSGAIITAGPDAGENPNRILYADGDPDARRLAERLAAMAAMSPLRDSSWAGIIEASPPPVAAALRPAEFAAAVQAARESAYILRLNRCFAGDCLELGTLLQAAEWLKPPGAARAPAIDLAEQLSTSGAAVPLVATRPHLVARRGLAGVRIEFDGTLRFDQAGWSANPNDAVTP
jgi:hypothetical protein